MCSIMAAPYVELHAHSAFSFLDGASAPEELAEQAAALGHPALALTDHAWESAYGSLSPGQVRYEIAWGAGHVVQADRPDLVIMAAAGLVSEARD